MNNEAFTTFEVNDQAALDQIYRLRVEVWRAVPNALAEHAFPDGQWSDVYDASSKHWAIADAKGEIVAAARLSLHRSLTEILEPFQYTRYGIAPVGLIAAPDRVVVSPAFQRHGLAARLLDLQDAAADQAGASCALRQASPSMCRLLVKRGWELMGPAQTDERFPGIEFTVAIKKFFSTKEASHAA